MNALESRYRRALRWYPRGWRDANADAVVGALLDQADAESRATPTRGDLRDLAIGGLRTRLDAVVHPDVRGSVAAAALATGAAYSATQLFSTFWAPLAPHRDLAAGFGDVGPFLDPGPLLVLGWVVALAAAFLGHQRVRRAAAAGVVLVAIGLSIAQLVAPSRADVSQPPLVFSAVLALASAVGTPPSRSRLAVQVLGWLAAFLLVDVANGVVVSQSSIWLWTLGPGNAAGITLGLIAACLLVGAVANLRRPRAAAVLLLSAVPWIVMWGLEVVTNPGRTFEAPFPLISGGALLLSFAGAVLLVRRAGRRRTDDAPTRAHL